MDKQYTWDRVIITLNGEEFKDIKPFEYRSASTMEYYHRRGNNIFLRGAIGTCKIELPDSALNDFQKLWKKGDLIKIEHSTEFTPN